MRYLFPALLVITLASCDTLSSPPDKDVPKAFQESADKGSFDFSRKYGGGGADVVNSMYNELVDDHAGLKALEKDIKNLSGNITDATAPYNGFVYNNSAYYNAAMHHVNSIRDAALKEKLRAMVQASNERYQQSVAKHNALLNEINNKQLTLTDVHTYLKLVKTLPVIESYQNKSLPGTSAMENVSAEIDRVIQRTKDASKQ